MANLTSLSINNSGYLRLPVGTTAQRASSVSGQVRYNSSKKELEVYNGTRWGSVQIQDPVLVTRGLQLHLDSGNIKSYPLDGTWYNTVSNSTGNAVLTSTTAVDTGVAFAAASSAGGSVTFNFAGGGFTQSVWIKHTTALTAAIQGYFTLASTVEGPVIRLAGPSSLEGYFFDSGRNYRGITVPNSVLTNRYYNFVFTYTGSIFTLYSNGVAIGELGGTYTLPAPGTTFSLSPGGGEAFYGNMYSVMYYNRALSATEVTQNFNALRGRYGL